MSDFYLRTRIDICYDLLALDASRSPVWTIESTMTTILSAFSQTLSAGRLTWIRRAARAADDRVLAVRAEVLVAAQAVRTTHATAGEPAEPDAVAGVDFFYLVACGDDTT